MVTIHATAEASVPVTCAIIGDIAHHPGAVLFLQGLLALALGELDHKPVCFRGRIFCDMSVPVFLCLDEGSACRSRIQILRIFRRGI